MLPLEAAQGTACCYHAMAGDLGSEGIAAAGVAYCAGGGFELGGEDGVGCECAGGDLEEEGVDFFVVGG